jgi:hypothetical protein
MDYMSSLPAGYQQKPYSLLDNQEFKTAYGTEEKSSAPEAEEPMFSKSTAQAAAQGAQFGGLSGALTAGGVSSLLTSGAAAGGPYAIAGGLILSQIEANQKAKAAAEQERVQNEKNRMASMQSMYEKMANQSYNV